MRVTRWFAGFLQQPRMRRVRTSTTRDRERFLKRISSSTTTFKTCRRTGTSCRSEPLDPRAQKLPLPDDLMGELLRFVVAHEVGHTLGLQHNMKASSIYTLEQIRDKNFLQQFGHTPSHHGLLALQLCRATRGWHSRGGSDPENRRVRQVGDPLGICSDHRRADLGRGADCS